MFFHILLKNRINTSKVFNADAAVLTLWDVSFQISSDLTKPRTDPMDVTAPEDKIRFLSL